MQGSQRWITGVLIVIALLTFFFPLATVQIPVLGNQDFSGYDLISKARNFQQIAERSRELRDQQPEATAPDSGNPESAESALPLSVRALPFLPFAILASFALGAVALFGLMTDVGSSGFLKGTTAVAAALAILSAVYIAVVNSDLHSYFQQQINASSSAAGDNPFAGLVQLAANAIQLKPGIGLYALAGVLSLATVLLNVLPQVSPDFNDDAVEPPRRGGFLGLEQGATSERAVANTPSVQRAASGCEQCGHFLRPTDRFCPGCGIAILSADRDSAHNGVERQTAR
jgi:hypothetical protein